MDCKLKIYVGTLMEKYILNNSVCIAVVRGCTANVSRRMTYTMSYNKECKLFSMNYTENIISRSK